MKKSAARECEWDAGRIDEINLGHSQGENAGPSTIIQSGGTFTFQTIDRNQICLKHFFFSSNQKREIYCQI